MRKSKNKKKNPESYKIIYFQIGMIIALLSVLYAFEHKSFESYEITHRDINPDDTPVEFIDPTFHRKPPPPPPPPANPIGKINVDNTNTVNDGNIEINAEDLPDNPMPEYTPVFEPEPEIEMPEPVYQFPSQRASFYGGYAAMMEFMGSNLRYPALAREMNISGTVYLQFVVEKNGKISNIIVLREIAGGCTEEALRVLELMPPWEPGLQNGKPVRSSFNLPVKFSLR